MDGLDSGEVSLSDGLAGCLLIKEDKLGLTDFWNPCCRLEAHCVGDVHDHLFGNRDLLCILFRN